MGNAYRAPYSVAKANRDDKVSRWKAIGKFKKQQKREEREAAAGKAPVNAAAGDARIAIPLPTRVPEQLRAKKKPKGTPMRQRPQARRMPRGRSDSASRLWRRTSGQTCSGRQQTGDGSWRKRSGRERSRPRS